MIFSPAAAAGSVGGYKALAKALTDAGIALIEVAFKNDDPAERGAQFSEVVDWLEKKKLPVEIDLKRVTAGGHSRGGWAAIVAAKRDRRFTACLAFNPSGPETVEGPNDPRVCIITGDDPEDVKTARALKGKFGRAEIPAPIAGLNHQLQPNDKSATAFRHAVDFLTKASGE